MLCVASRLRLPFGMNGRHLFCVHDRDGWVVEGGKGIKGGKGGQEATK